MKVNREILLPIYLPFFSPAFDPSSDENKRAINDLFQAVLSNAFPRLRICISARIEPLDPNEAWTGSPALRTLQLDMRTTEGFEQLFSACPNLRRFTSCHIFGIAPLKGNNVYSNQRQDENRLHF